MFLRTLYLTVAIIFITFSVQAAKVTQFLPADHTFNQTIATPESSLGFGLGERHPRHDQLLTYMELLAEQSNRIKITDIGQTTQLRKQVLMTISSPENISNIDEILKNRSLGRSGSSEPLVVWLGYSVHGDEISGANAAMAVAYYLAASEHQDTAEMLKNTVIVIEPSINPDGMDRFVQWVTTHRGSTLNDDPNHIEHHQGWRTGRTNHFGFDLNRDWLLLSQKESRNRVEFFHQYKPHVLGDFHEMGAHGTYFFQPGIPTRTHPLTPKSNTKLTQLLATFHAKALDKKKRLYYSEENFDDFYYGKGSTYPDINGGVGILFEQASSRGLQQQSVNGLVTFEYGIENQVITSLSTIEGAWKSRQELINYQRNFYQESIKLAGNAKFNGYLLHEAKDSYRLNAFLEKLAAHQIDVFPLAEDFRLEGKVYQQEHSYYVPLKQKQFRLIEALFSQGKDFQDNTFYDVSGWTMPLAMNIEFHQVDRTWGLKLNDKTWQPTIKTPALIDHQAYAYVFEWHEYLAPKLLNKLLSEGIKAKVATKTFSANVNGAMVDFDLGSILIPATLQNVDDWQAKLETASQEIGLSLTSLTTGLTVKGIDIGSGSFKLLSPIKVLLMGGKGVSQYEAAEVLYYLDDTLSIPVTVVELPRISRVDLSAYSHIIMVDGQYGALGKTATANIEKWVRAGGVIIGQKRGTKWLASKDLLAANFVSKSQLNDLFDTDNLTYKDKEKLAGRKRIAGAIFETSLDTSHPLGYGYSNDKLPLFRNSTLIMDQKNAPFVTVAKYTPTPLMSGYADRTMVNRVANTTAILGHNYGKGRVIASSDVLAFRGYWFGSSKLLANSLFFGKAFSANKNN